MFELWSYVLCGALGAFLGTFYGGLRACCPKVPAVCSLPQVDRVFLVNVEGKLRLREVFVHDKQFFCLHWGAVNAYDNLVQLADGGAIVGHEHIRWRPAGAISSELVLVYVRPILESEPEVGIPVVVADNKAKGT